MANFVFTDWPITKKLMWIMHGATLLAVLFASVLFGASEAISYRKATLDQIATLSGVIGTNSTAAITFEDSDLANQVLRSLDANQSIIAAHIFLTSGRLFSSYGNANETGLAEISNGEAVQRLRDAVASSKTPQQRFEGLSYLDAVHPIRFDTEVIGYLHLRTSLGSFVTTLRRIVAVAAIVMLLAVIVAYIFVVPAAVCRVVSDPAVVRANEAGQ